MLASMNSENAMKIDDFRKAKRIEEKIQDINHIINGLNQRTFYKLSLIGSDGDVSKVLSEHLGREYMEQANRDLIDALTLKRLQLQEEFARYVSP